MNHAGFVCLLAMAASLSAVPPLRVVAYDAAGRQVHAGQGTALDAAGSIVTARSLLVGAQRVDVTTPSGTTLPVQWVVAEDPGAGLVKLWVAFLDSQPPAFSPQAPEAKSALLIDGKPTEVDRIRDIPGSGLIARLNAATTDTVPGAPVLDAQGRVAGFLIPQFLGTRDVAFCVPAGRAFAFGNQPLITIGEWSARHSRAAEEAYQLALGEVWAEYYDSAAKNLEEVVIEERNFPEAWFFLGYAHAKLGHVDEKILYYRRAIALKPDYAEAHFSLGISYLLQGKRDDAKQEADTLRKIPAVDLADRLTRLIDAIHVDSIGGHEDDVI